MPKATPRVQKHIVCYAAIQQEYNAAVQNASTGKHQNLLCADYPSYIAAQEKVGRTYLHPATWQRMSILNVARVGKFSSDRAIHEYCEKIWQVNPVFID